MFWLFKGFLQQDRRSRRESVHPKIKFACFRFGAPSTDILAELFFGLSTQQHLGTQYFLNLEMGCGSVRKRDGFDAKR